MPPAERHRNSSIGLNNEDARTRQTTDRQTDRQTMRRNRLNRLRCDSILPSKNGLLVQLC